MSNKEVVVVAASSGRIGTQLIGDYQSRCSVCGWSLQNAGQNVPYEPV